MGFVLGQNNGVKFVLTDEGKRSMLERGLNDSIKFFSVHDDEVIYTVDIYPNVLDVNGSNDNTTLVNKAAYKQNLK